MENALNISSGKMSQEHSQVIKEKTSDVSSRRSVASVTQKYQYLSLINGNQQEKSWVMVTRPHGGNSMPNTGECPKEENVSTLSQILMVCVPERYYLSQKACLGILRRASERGKKLPELLQKALEKQANLMTA